MSLIDSENHPNNGFSVRSWLVNGIRKSRWFKRGAGSHLPFEIWQMILAIAIEPLTHPYRQCDWLTFPIHHERMDHWIPTDIADWKHYRLVCRAFAEILRAPLEFTISSGDSSPPEGVKILHIRSKPITSIIKLLSTSSVSRSITTLSICHTEYDSGSQSILLLMHGSKAMPELRSLRLWNSLPLNFWKLLEEAFPSLVELHLRSGARCDTPVILCNLEILHIDAFEEGSLLYCPQLKHLLIRRRLGWGPFLERHATNLESLLTKELNPWFHQPDIRSQFTSLRTYGEHLVSVRVPPAVIFLSLPPPEHLCLFPSALYSPSTVSVILHEIDRWDNIRFISLSARALPRIEADPIIETCKKRGGHFTWLPPIEHPTGKPYGRYLCDTYILTYIIEPIVYVVYVVVACLCSSIFDA
jgi:hypothetical protein